MTMADTVAVMNAGVIEQMGPPMELYEHPRTTFAANFLGQSNLVRGHVDGPQGESVAVTVEGTKLRAPASRSVGADGDVWVGIRPEKVFLSQAGAEADDAPNVLRGGVVTDVSYIGVSTQYLARMPWGQELMVFEQNTGARDHFGVGETVDLHWRPEHTFLLDAAQDATAGVQREDAE
jgi:spermidine/putrescine transport system ATP-binding protein